MPELAMAATLAHLPPAVFFQDRNHLMNFFAT
jgi:hypothetical protein